MCVCDNLVYSFEINDINADGRWELPWECSGVRRWEGDGVDLHGAVRVHPVFLSLSHTLTVSLFLVSLSSSRSHTVSLVLVSFFLSLTHTLSLSLSRSLSHSTERALHFPQ